MSQFISFSQSGNNYYVSCSHADFDTSNFYFERGGSGQIKRVSINLIDLNTGNTYPFASSNFEILANKMDSKISKLIRDRIKGIGLEEAEKLNEEANRINTFLESPLKYLSEQSKKFEIEYFLRKDNIEEREPEKHVVEDFKSPPKKPDKSIYKPKVNCFHILFGMKGKQITKSRSNYRQALKSWDSNTRSFLKELQSHNTLQEKKEREYEKQLKDFQRRKREFEAEKESFNSELMSFKNLNKDSDERLIEKYFGLFLKSFSINNWFHIESAVFFENGTLIIDSELPHSVILPKS